jgi:transposase InsO family protein
VSYINIAGNCYFLTSVLDGYSRFIVHWEIRESMTERDVETIVQRALEQYPDEKRRIISENGPQFIARDFKEFIRLESITHVRTRFYYRQSNGKIDRWHGSVKQERATGVARFARGTQTYLNAYADHSNTVCLHSA